jgi:hypothetical protein
MRQLVCVCAVCITSFYGDEYASEADSCVGGGTSSEREVDVGIAGLGALSVFGGRK